MQKLLTLITVGLMLLPATSEAKRRKLFQPRSDVSTNYILVDISSQMIYLKNSRNRVVHKGPISSGRPGKPTPIGTFRITERQAHGKVSNIYNVAMPFWLRLNRTAYGIHAGHLPGYPASAGCIRVRHDTARILYRATRAGSMVVIVQ